MEKNIYANEGQSLFVVLTRLQQPHTLWPAFILNVCLGRAVTNYQAKQLIC